MQSLINKIESLQKSDLKNIIDKRITEFKEINKESNDELFKEICFCIMTANYNAEKSIKIQSEIGNYFLTPSQEILSSKLKECGHRFPNMRADYICKSFKHKESLVKIIKSNNGEELRDWFVKNIKGLGYKEASHFLRNIGFDDYAIIDFHIIDLLVYHDLIDKPNSITKNKYIEIENKLKEIAKKTNLTLAELDLYLWYIETGKILK